MNLLRNTHEMDLHKMMLVFFYIYLSCLSFVFTQTVSVPSENKNDNAASITQTVYGFLDFTTTIGNTVMVFSPQSASTTSEKSTVQDTVTVINEKPRTESGNSATEIKPSKTATSSQTSQLDNKVESKNVGKNETSVDKSDKSKDAENKKPTTKGATSTTTAALNVLKSTTHSHGAAPATSSDNKTNATKSKTEKSANKATSKSLPQNSTTKSVTKSDKAKSTPKATTVGKLNPVTESNSSPQLISTKKFNKEAEKTKPTTKPETTTKANVTPKAQHKLEIKSNKLLATNQTTSNVTSKPIVKSTAKSDKPKTTTKTTTKSESVSVSEPPSPSPKNQDTEKITSSVIIASKVEIREGPTSVQKVAKKQEIEPSNVDQSLSSSAQIKNEDQSNSSSTTSDVSEQQTKTTQAKEENTSGTDEPAVISSSGVLAPEYDFLSRQPSEVVDETFKVIDLKPNSASGKHQKQKNTYRGTTPPPVDNYEETQPLGLITSLSDSIIKDGLTTVYETNVIGTVISGKYAQVLQSNSHVQNQKKIKPSPSSSARILKTAAPTSLKSSKIPNLDPTPVNAYEDDSSSLFLEPYNIDASNIKPSRKPSIGSNSFSKNKYSSNKNKFREDYREDYSTTSSEDEDILDTDYTLASANPTSPSYSQSTSPSKKTTAKNKSNQNGRPFKSQNNRFSKPTTPELATVSVFSESKASAVTPSYSAAGGRRFTPSNRRSTAKPATTSSETERGFTNKRTGFKHKIGPSNVDNNISPVSTSKFKLIRPSGRWQYKTSPRPRVTIRRQDENLDNVTVSPMPQFTPDIQLETDQELSGSGIFPALQHEDNSIVHDVSPSWSPETLRVEISTPADFKDVYYEIATIKTPYTYSIGTVRHVRFNTVTSTYEKSLVQATESPTSRSEPLSENILASTHNAYDKEPPLDSSIATLPPIGLAGDAETPPLETITESFSTTQLMLKTHILPVVRGGSDTTKYTLVQSYHVTRLVTATKTLPPMEVYQFVPTKALNEFNTRLDEAGSEVHLELEFGDNNEQDDEGRPNVSKALLSDLDLTNIGSDFDIADVDKNKILEQHLRSKKAHKLTTSSTPAPPPHTSETPSTPALSPEQLQQLALLRLLNPNAAGMPNLVTSSKPILRVETAYETFVLPVFNAGSTIFSTISRPTATVTKTEYEYVTNTLPSMQPSIFNPLFPPQPSFQIATTPLITQTMLTETDSKVLKLTFGAKTAYTTVYSTKVTPTILTTYITNSIQIQPTAATFPGFFNPAPYGYNPPFPFIG